MKFDTGISIMLHPRDQFKVTWSGARRSLNIAVSEQTGQEVCFFESDGFSILDNLADVLRENGYAVAKDNDQKGEK